MQTRRDFVIAIVELAARVQLCHHQFERAASGFDVRIDRNAASVVANRNHAVRQELDHDVVGVTSHRFIGRVVQDFAHQDEQTDAPCVADIHSGTMAHGFKSFEPGNVFRRVIAVVGFGFCHKRKTPISNRDARRYSRTQNEYSNERKAMVKSGGKKREITL